MSHTFRRGPSCDLEHGMNECLHRRLSMVAERQDCDSYYFEPYLRTLPEGRRYGIDTDALEKSRFVLICDQDLVEIEV